MERMEGGCWNGARKKKKKKKKKAKLCERRVCAKPPKHKVEEALARFGLHSQNPRSGHYNNVTVILIKCVLHNFFSFSSEKRLQRRVTKTRMMPGHKEDVACG